MIGLVQRAAAARVEVGGRVVGAIGPGLLVLVCAEPGDDAGTVRRFVDKLLKLRIMADEAGRMNRSVVDTGGGLLIVSQFTLAADTTGGNRPSFTRAAPPDQGRALYDAVLAEARARHRQVEAGVFGADMRVFLEGDGPVTIPLQVN